MMNYLHRLVASAVLVFLFVTPSRAISGVGVTLINYTFDTVGFSYTITINARVSNYDSVPFAGVLDFGLRNDHQVLSNTGIFNKPPYSQNQVSLYPYETVPAIFSVDIDPQYFSPGPDVVVVWPICTKPIVDSILINIFVETPSVVKNEKEELFNYIVMNDRIFLKSLSSETNIQQVRLFDVLGRQISEARASFITEFPIPTTAKGIYLAEFLAVDGRRKVVKFFH